MLQQIWVEVLKQIKVFGKVLGILLKKQIQNQNTILLHESWMLVYEEIPDSHSL